MMPRGTSCGRLRSYGACLNCRRKKTRCPAERPVCSNCARLNQSCLYTFGHRESPGESDRLASLEEKVNSIMKGSRPHDETSDIGHLSPATSSSSFPGESSWILGDPFAADFGSEDGSLHLTSPTVAKAVDSYFQYCHRQPIWCFDYEDLEGMGFLSKELVYSILALISRFSRAHDQVQFYASTARTLIMLRVANGTVDLETIESLCLLSYSFFTDGDLHLGQFHLGLAFQLCLSAMFDLEAVAAAENPVEQRKKRVFWSLLSLEQCFGHQSGHLRVSTETLCPCCVPDKADELPLPQSRDETASRSSSDIDIWSLAVHFGWIWSRVRTYVSDCAQNKLKEPWRHDSMYGMILSHLTEAENKLSQRHRYESVKFYERKADEVRANRSYWGPWLKLQFTYHCILTMLNHPFLYIVASQHNPNLAIPNAFWRRSSELALLHATWIVRVIDMVSDKKLRLTDPFFGHAAAIAATVHLYYCRAADPRLKFKSKTDLAKCRKFLEGFGSFSPACQRLGQTLERILQIAFGSENVDYDWTPSRIYLSVSLMWDVLRANYMPESQSPAGTGLLHSSLIPTVSREDSAHTSSTLEIIVAMSPEVTVNTADGGQAAHMPPRVRSSSTTPVPPAPPAQSRGAGGAYSNTLGSTYPGSVEGERLIVPNDDLMLNTPWLWNGIATDPDQFPGTEGAGNRQELENTMDGFFTWWDLGNL